MSIKLKIGKQLKKPHNNDAENIFYNIQLDITKTVDDNLLIYDHPDIDIMISPAKFKIISFSKDSLDDSSYASQKRLFDYLRNKGAIIYDSVQGGNVLGSMEATYPEESENANTTQFALFVISNFIKKDSPDVLFTKGIKDKREQEMTDPPISKSTELGQIPHAEMKGAIDKRSIGSSYGSAPGWRVF